MGLMLSHSSGFAMIDVDDHFHAMNEATQIWGEPQFTVADLCAITGITPKALEHFIDPKRDLVRLHGNHANPGKGKRRIFTGSQVLMIKAAYLMSDLGFPQRFSRTMTEEISRRAMHVTIGLALQSGLTILTYPQKNGDWAVLRIYDDTTEPPKMPVAVQALDVDRLITETKAQLEAVIAGEEIPDFSVPEIGPEPNPYSPSTNFFRTWDKDEQGRWKYIGLTWDESQELMADEGVRLNGDEIEFIGGERPARDHARGDYFLELINRREEARLRACGFGMGED